MASAPEHPSRGPQLGSHRPPPPVAPRRPHAISAHGHERIDDWYWLRERENPEVRALLEAENAHTDAATRWMAPLVEEVYGEIVASVRLTDVSHPTPDGRYGYYVRTVEGLEHPVHCRRLLTAPAPPLEPGSTSVPVAPADEHEEILLDENTLALGHAYLEVGSLEVSPDHRLLAYSVDTTGGEVFTVRVRDLDRGLDLPDVVENTSYGLAFSSDSSVLFFTRPDEAMRPYQVWRHRLGTDVDSDDRVVEEEDERYFVGVASSKDRRYVIVESASKTTTEVRLLDASMPMGDPVVVDRRRDGIEYSVEHHHGELIVLSNDGAENFALFRAPVETGSHEHWIPLLAGRDDVRLDSADVLEGYAVVHERGNGSTAVRILGLGGAPTTVLAPPEEAGVIYPAENPDFGRGVLRYATSSLVTPVTLHDLDLASGIAEQVWQQSVPGYDPVAYRTERRLARSDDGTEVPVTLAYRADRGDRPGPCLLYGYGAYEASTDPVFSRRRPVRPLLDRGGTYAIAHVRGGGELGRRWYLDGKLANKHRGFEDFVAVGRDLVARGVTTPRQLVALGGSAGGLLVGASTNRAPELFAGVVAAVPFVDVLTTMLDPDLPLTVTEWEEWGNPLEDEQAYYDILAYSPYDNVAPVEYPKMLVTGGLNDPRVSYFEPTKWVQRIRAAHQANMDRVLLKIEMDSGHAGPSGRYHAWHEWAFELAFVLATSGAYPPELVGDVRLTS